MRAQRVRHRLIKQKKSPDSYRMISHVRSDQSSPYHTSQKSVQNNSWVNLLLKIYARDSDDDLKSSELGKWPEDSVGEVTTRCRDLTIKGTNVSPL